MSIHPRRALVSQARQFVETQLVGLYSWNDAALREAIPLPPINPETQRPNPHNAKRELIEVDLGAYTLRVYSSEECPPVGAIELEHDGEAIEAGRIDSQTWERFGKIIRKREERQNGGS